MTPPNPKSPAPAGGSLIKWLALAFSGFILLVIYWASSGSLPRLLTRLTAFPGGDKVGHFLLWGLLSLLVNLALPGRSFKLFGRAVPPGSLLAAVSASLEELFQFLSPHRTPDLLDWLAGMLGILLAALFLRRVAPALRRLDHFDLLASNYDRLIHFDRLETTLEMLALPAAGRLLDAGGGTGRVAAGLRPHVDEVVLADLSRRMLAQARGKGLITVLAPSERLPFPEGAFARVLMVDALHHVMHQPETAAELWRVLQPGGRLVIEEPDIRNFAVKMIALAEKLALMRSHFLAPARIAALLPPEARVEIKTQDGTAWVIAEKPGAQPML